jgi:hypothetical protein
VRRVNAIADKLTAGLTAADFRDCSIGMKEFSSQAVTGAQNGGLAIPAAGAVAAARKTPDRSARSSRPGKVTLSVKQLRINQRISQGAVRRINRLRAELAAGLAGANVKNGSLARATLAPPVQTGGR